MSKSLISKNVVIGEQRTSFRLEPEMWSALEHICEKEGVNIHKLCTWISDFKPRANRTSAIRAFIISYFRAVVDNMPFHIGHDDECLCAQHDMGPKLCHILRDN
ncbi:MAG: ribbon-helix-helix domain-containing protein [Methylocystaceae bacterium]|nr:ribbon-helix-helix domain-containing protein [Methylocystaceae bacterium]